MLNTDLMQFKDEMLKNLREMEKKILIKINKNQSDLSTEINTINDSIKLMKENNNSLIESMAEHQLNIDKFSELERTLKKINNTLTSHENRIDDSMSEISYIRNRCEKSINETLSVPGMIGKNCKYFNFNDYINNSIKEIAQLKTEKDFNKKEFKELKLKLNQGLKNLSNLIDSFINRAKMYTDNTKRNIIELMDSKINELNEKNMEIMTKIYKIEEETEEKIKKFEENIEELNKNKDDHFQIIEDKLLTINNSLEEINKNITTTKEDLNSIKVKEEKNKSEINELKNLFKEFCRRKNNNNKWSNDTIKTYNKENYMGTNYSNFQNTVKYRDTYAVSSKTNFIFSHDYLNSNNKNKEQNKINNDNNDNNEFKSRKMKISKTSRNTLLFSNINSNNAIYNTNNNKNIIQTTNNSSENVHKKLLKTKNSEILEKIEKEEKEEKTEKIKIRERKKDENKNQTDEMSQTLEDENLSKNVNKNMELFNKSKISNKYNKNYDTVSNKEHSIISNNKFSKKNNTNNYTSFDTNTISDTNDKDCINMNKLSRNHNSFESNIIAYKNEKKEPKIKKQESIILHQLMKKKIDYIISDKKRNRYLPAIKNKNHQLTYSLNTIKKKLLNNDDFLAIENFNNKKKKNIQEYYKYINKNNKQVCIDKETGTGCKIVKISFDENSMTPYNTNGLLTIASKKYLNRHLIKVNESTPLDDIYLNMYQTYKNNSYPKKTINYSKTTNIFFNNNSVDNVDENKIGKTNINAINHNFKLKYGKVKFHYIKK